MGFASYFEDVSLRTTENGLDSGVVRPAIDPPSDDRSHGTGESTPATRRRPRTIHLEGEEANRFVLKEICGYKEIAYLQVIETRTGHLVREFPYRQRAEVEACLARVESEHPGALRLVVVKRLEPPK